MSALKKPKTGPAPTPIGGLYDPRFVYVPAAATDIRKTFERIRAQKPLVSNQLAADSVAAKGKQ